MIMANSVSLLTLCLLVGSFYILLCIPMQVSGGYNVGKPLKRRRATPTPPPSLPKSGPRRPYNINRAPRIAIKPPPPRKSPNPYKNTRPRIKPPSQKPPPKISPYPTSNNGWLPAMATWYGSPTGAGTDGGACGYGSLPTSPYGSRVTAGSPVLFKAGLGCGACYQVKCLAGAICSPQPVTVVITDECPGGYCASGKTHFDLSGAAFSAMASSTSSTQSLLNTGVVQVLYRRVPCSYSRGTKLSFQVNQGANNYWFSMLIRYVGGDGDVSAVDLMEAGGGGLQGQWRRMEHLWGAYWCLISSAGPLRAPFSVRVTTSSGASLSASDVIPANWAPGQTYASHANFFY